MTCVSKKIEKKEEQDYREVEMPNLPAGRPGSLWRCILGAEYHLKRVGTQTSCPGVLQNGDGVSSSLFGKWVDLLRLRQSVRSTIEQFCGPNNSGYFLPHIRFVLRDLVEGPSNGMIVFRAEIR